MHAGHLRIEGLKMSKSLKNFITIEEALSQWTANELRWMFLTNKWDATLEFSNDRINTIRGSIASFTVKTTCFAFIHREFIRAEFLR